MITRLAFGDSYTYVQGTHGHQNYSFIGDLFNYSYDEETLLSNEIVQNQVSRLFLSEGSESMLICPPDWHRGGWP